MILLKIKSDVYIKNYIIYNLFKFFNDLKVPSSIKVRTALGKYLIYLKFL